MLFKFCNEGLEFLTVAATNLVHTPQKRQETRKNILIKRQEVKFKKTQLAFVWREVTRLLKI